MAFTMAAGKFQFCVILVYLSFGTSPASVFPPNTTLIVGSLLIEPFLMTHTFQGGIHYEGYIYDLLEELKKKLDINFSLHVRDDNEFGYKLRNGSWGGLIGDIVSKDVDVVAAPITETANRLQRAEFSTPFMTFGQVVILKKPSTVIMTLPKRFQRLYSPLSEGVWLTSIFVWLGTSIVLYVIGHVNPYEWRRLAKHREATMRESEASNCPNIFFFMISTGLLQGYTRAPRSLGGRIVACAWWTYVLSFVIMYIASMTNYLKIGPTETLVNENWHIQKLEDLANQQKVTYGVLRNGATLQYLKNSPNHRLRRMGEEIQSNDRYEDTIEAGITKVRESNEPYAFITESALAYYYAKQQPCDIYMIGDFTVGGSYSIALRPHMPNEEKTKLNIALLELKETGIMKKLHDKWFTGVCSDGFLMDSSQTEQLKVPPFYKVDMATFSGAIMLLGIGVGIGALVTVVEIVIYRKAENEKLEEQEQREADKAQRALNQDGTELYESRAIWD